MSPGPSQRIFAAARRAAVGSTWLVACTPTPELPPETSGTSGPTTTNLATDPGDSTGSLSTGSTTGTPTTTQSPTTEPGTTANGSTITTGTDATTSADSDSDTMPLLHIEPAQAQLDIASGWSFPTQFTAFLGDTPVPAVWSLDNPALGRITRHGGTFDARNTSAGPVQISAEYDGQVALADLDVVLVDDHPVCPPRPPLTDGEPAPGAFVRVVAPGYESTGVYHGVYLPPDWTPGRRYPVIVESPCNTYGTFTGKVEDTRLGYHIAGCRNYVWIVLPYIKNQANLDYGWGELDTNLDYWQTNIPRTLAAVGGDPGAVIVGGFSRGAIGASYVGLANDTLADAWLGFLLHSHADVVSNLTPDGGAGSATRMGRIAGRASLLSWGGDGDGGMANSVKGAALLTSFGYPVSTLEVPNVGHTDAWSIDDEASRIAAQTWLFTTVAAGPGTGSVYGRVTNAQAQGVPGVRIEAGPLHFATTDAAGYYALRGLVHGLRTIACLDPICSGPQMVDVGDADAGDIDFITAP